MRKPTLVPTDATANPVYLTAAAISSLIQSLPSGTAYCIGMALMVMMTGRLMQHKGSLARAVLPRVSHLRWGWHRVERAMERGQLLLDGLFDRAYEWCLTQLDVEPVRLGCQRREVTAIDSSTIARLRCQVGRVALLGKGYCHRAGRAVRANIGAAAVSIVLIRGVRLGLVRRVRFGASCEAAVSKLFADLPKSAAARLIVVDAGIATKEQFAAATAHDALLGRLRRNCKLRCAPPPPNGKRGRNPLHGPVLQPGRAEPEVAPDEDLTFPSEAGPVRLRRWNRVPWEGYHETPLDVLRVDDPSYPEPLLVGTVAYELTTEELWQAYPHRWPVAVSSEGHILQSVEVRPRLKDSSLVAWEAPWRESKTAEPSDNVLEMEYRQSTRLQRAVNVEVASLHAIPVAETVYNGRRQQGPLETSLTRRLSPAGYQRRQGTKEDGSTGEARGARRGKLAEEASPITVSGKGRRRRPGGGSGRSTGDRRATKRAWREGPGPVSAPLVKVRQG
jgi:hypothetical protein